MKFLSKEDLYLSLEHEPSLTLDPPKIEAKDLILDFVASIPNFQNNEHDGKRLQKSVWITPEMALEKASSGEMQMIMPTLKNLESCCGFKSADELITVIKKISPKDKPSILPKVFKENGTWVGLLPGEMRI